STGRPNGSETRAARHSPPSERCRTDAVPSPPSATGRAAASTPWTRRSPRTRRAAASTGPRTPLRLAGHARACRVRLLHRLRQLGVRLGHVLEHGVREPLPREEEEPDADADGRLDRLQADPERDALRVVDAVLAERQRD